MFEAIQPRLRRVEEFISDQLSRGPDAVREMGAYVFEGGGKRFRPALLLVVSRMLGYEGDRDVRYGAVVEMIHTATLVHDDIIDHASVRRGRASANNRWGNQLTVLFGDWLYTRSMELALDVGDVGVMRVLSRATVKMIEGEMLGLDVEGRDDTDESTYLEIIRRKTAEIFAAACSIPTLFHPGLARHRQALEDYGLNLGISFQIADDLLDLTATESSLGKPVFSDLREGKLTLPFMRLLPRLDARCRAAVKHVLQTGELTADTREELLGLLEGHGVFEEVRNVARDYGRRAAAALEDLPPCAETDALRIAPSFVLDRVY